MSLLIRLLRASYAHLRSCMARHTPRESAAMTSGAKTPGDDSARCAKARALHGQGLLIEAETTYRELLQKYPGDFDLLHQLGIVLGQQGNFTAAAAFVEQSIAVDPANPDGYNCLGNCLRGVGKLDRALALRPDDADILSNHGATLRDLGRPLEALDSFDGLIAREPEHALAHYNRSITLAGLHRHEAALSSCDTAIALKPDFAQALYHQGNLLHKPATGSA